MDERKVGNPGDLCILLAPGLDERLSLRKEQEVLASFYGGWVVPEPHITCQRFRLGPDQKLGDLLGALKAAYQKVSPFTLYAAGLTQFLAPFWGTYVLRWQVLDDHAMRKFLQVTDATLRSAGCELYYAHEIPITCSAVDLTHHIPLDECPEVKFPHALFQARKIMITGILGINDFETVGEIGFEGSSL